MNTIITRVGFCMNCHLQRRPHTDQPFLVYGTNGYQIRYANRIGLYGFVPTIYEKLKPLGENVIVRKICGMESCGSEWYKENGFWLLRPVKGHWERVVYTLAQWNGLVLWKHDWDYHV